MRFLCNLAPQLQLNLQITWILFLIYIFSWNYIFPKQNYFFLILLLASCLCTGMRLMNAIWKSLVEKNIVINSDKVNIIIIFKLEFKNFFSNFNLVKILVKNLPHIYNNLIEFCFFTHFRRKIEFIRNIKLFSWLLQHKYKGFKLKQWKN